MIGNRQRVRPDRDAFAVMAIVLLGRLPWSVGKDYGVSSRTLRTRWAQWCEAAVFQRLAWATDGSTEARQWALDLAFAAAERAERASRSGHYSPVAALPAGPSPAEYRAARTAQNAFSE
jgi:hypothetical protein